MFLFLSLKTHADVQDEGIPSAILIHRSFLYRIKLNMQHLFKRKAYFYILLMLYRY